MTVIDETHIKKLIQLEDHIHYAELPPPGVEPFVCISRTSTIVLSAPHGARTFRNNLQEVWHEEDEYTASMALLLADICQTSVIATIWRTEESDPNEHGEARSAYKRALRNLTETNQPRPSWLIDLHGAGMDSKYLSDGQKLDIGKGKKTTYLPDEDDRKLREIIESRLGKGSIDRKGKSGFDAAGDHRMAAFAYNDLGLSSVQIEMKPSVRIPSRRADASMFAKEGSYSAELNDVIAMLQSLVDFIEYIQTKSKPDTKK